MQNQAYWTTRAEQVILGNEKTTAEYEAQLKKAYQKTITQINKDVSSFYGKYAKNNEISLPEAKQRLSPPDLKNFQQQQKEYIAEIESMENPEFSKSYISKLKTMSGKAYVTKMDEIKANIQHGIETLSTGFNTNLGNTLKIGYQDTLYKDLFEMDKAFGVAVDFTAPGGKQLEKAIKTKWLGENYSDRIWKNKTALINQLDQLLAQEFVRGKGPNAVAKLLSDKMGVDFKKAVRLVRTEMNFISNQATIESYAVAGIELYRYVATLDGRTSDICIELDNMVFKVVDASVGINLPPMHPHCRSTTIPDFLDDDIGALIDDRVARDENGKTIKVGADVSYKDWVNKYASSDYVKLIHPELLSKAAPYVPFTLLGKSYDEVKAMVMDGTLPTDEYSAKELLQGIVAWAGTNSGYTDPIDAYQSYMVKKAASKLGLVDASDLMYDPFLIDKALNGVTDIQAKNRFWVGAPVDDLLGYMQNNSISAYEVMDRYQIHSFNYKNAFAKEEIAKTLNSIYLAGDLQAGLSKSKTFFDAASKKDASSIYKNVVKQFQYAYKLENLPSKYLSDFIQGKYSTLDEALFAKQKAVEDAAEKKLQKDAAKYAAQLADPNVKIPAVTDEQLDKYLKTAQVPDNRYDADKIYRKWTAANWNNYTKDEIQAAYEYTAGSGKFNRPIQGYKYSWGSGNYDLMTDLNSEQGEKSIKDLYRMIDKSPIPKTITVRRGGQLDELINKETGMFKDFLTNDYPFDDLGTVFKSREQIIGTRVQIDNFLSVGVSKEAGFTNTAVEYKIVLPAGTKATYAEPYSHYGGTKETTNYNGSPVSPNSISSEAEIIVQAGTRYVVSDIKKAPKGMGVSVYVELIAIPESQTTPPVSKKENVLNKYIDKVGAETKFIRSGEFDDKGNEKFTNLTLGKFEEIYTNKGEPWEILQAQVNSVPKYQAAMKLEPAITDTIKQIALDSKMEPEGLQFRTKTMDSYLKKIEIKWNEGSKNYEAKDLVRYTLTSTPDTLVKKSQEALKLLKNSGYKVVKISNTWAETDNPYKGVNINLENKDGFKFELQFHTPESFYTKDVLMHNLYEEARNIKDKSSSKYLALQQEMEQLSKNLVVPDSIGDLG